MDISSATARVAPDQLKPLAILSDTTVIRSAVDRDDLKGDQQSYYWQDFQTLLTTERRLTG